MAARPPERRRPGAGYPRDATTTIRTAEHTDPATDRLRTVEYLGVTMPAFVRDRVTAANDERITALAVRMHRLPPAVIDAINREGSRLGVRHVARPDRTDVEVAIATALVSIAERALLAGVAS